MLSDARQRLSSILNPISYDQFFEEFVGQKPLISLGDESGLRAALAGTDPRIGLLDGFEKYAPTLTCHSHSPKTPPPEARPVESPEGFYSLMQEYFRLGYTVRFPEVTDLSDDLSLFTRSLEKLLLTPVGVVVFWSAPGAAAPIHHDEVDVIVIQLVGTKKWFISEQPPAFPNKWKQAGEGPPAMTQYKTVDVGPGDLLYLPRGTAHTVQSTSESIHLSIGFVPITVRDALNSVLDHYSDLNRPVRMDAGIRADSIAQGADWETLTKQIKDHLNQLQSSCSQEQFIRTALHRQKTRMIVDLPKLRPNGDPNNLSLQTLVEHNPLAIADLIATDNIVDFSQPGEQILVHLGAEECMQFILLNKQFKIADIPGEIADEVRIALVSRLVASGFLQQTKQL